MEIILGYLIISGVLMAYCIYTAPNDPYDNEL